MENLPIPAPDWAYFLDVDGTLVELADSPDEVFVPPRLTLLLTSIYQRCNGALALVSGRSLARLDSMLGMPGLPMAGQHGLEWRNAQGESYRYTEACQLVEEMYAHLEPLKIKFPSLVVENKGFSIAIHYRRAPFLAAYLQNFIDDLLAGHEDTLHLQHGKCVLEVKPLGHNKGSAIRTLMTQAPFEGRRPVFVGDDVTDEDGFAAVNALGGISVKIGQGKTHAAYRLPNVSGVMQWLQLLSANTGVEPASNRQSREFDKFQVGRQ